MNRSRVDTVREQPAQQSEHQQEESASALHFQNEAGFRRNPTEFEGNMGSWQCKSRQFKVTLGPTKRVPHDENVSVAHSHREAGFKRNPAELQEFEGNMGGCQSRLKQFEGPPGGVTKLVTRVRGFPGVHKASSARRKRASGTFSKAGLSERLGPGEPSNGQICLSDWTPGNPRTVRSVRATEPKEDPRKIRQRKPNCGLKPRRTPPSSPARNAPR